MRFHRPLYRNRSAAFRIATDEGEHGRWRFGGVRFDEASGDLTVLGQPVEIERKCAAILGALLRRSGEPLNKDELLAIGWPDRVVHENSLTKAIGRLRHALGPAGEQIEAVYRRGYMLRGPVERLRDPRRGSLGHGSQTPGVAVGAILAACGLIVAGLAVAWGWEAHRNLAEKERETETLLGFLSSDIFTRAEPRPASEPQSIRRAVERAAATMDNRLRDDLASRAILHRLTGHAFSGWGEYEHAVREFNRAHALYVRLHGDMARENVPVDIALCHNLRLAGETRRAEGICQRAEQAARRFGSSLLNSARVARAGLQLEIGAYDRAAEVLADVLNDSDQLPVADRGDAEWFHALALHRLARFEEADLAFRHHLAWISMVTGPRHPLVARAHSGYGDLLVSVGKFTQAEEHFAAAQAIVDSAPAIGDLDPLLPAYGRARAALLTEQWGQAQAVLRPLLTSSRKRFGAEDLRTVSVMTDLALADAYAGELLRANALLREARRIGARMLYGRDGRAVDFHVRWARTLVALGRTNDAAHEHRLAADAMDRTGMRTDHPGRARLHCLAGRIALARNDIEAVRQEVRACLAALRTLDGVPPGYPPEEEANRLAAIDRVQLR